MAFPALPKASPPGLSPSPATIAALDRVWKLKVTV